MAPADCLGWLVPPSSWNCLVVFHRWEWLDLSRKAPEMDVAEGWGLFLLPLASLPKIPPWLEAKIPLPTRICIPMGMRPFPGRQGCSPPTPSPDTAGRGRRRKRRKRELHITL